MPKTRAGSIDGASTVRRRVVDVVNCTAGSVRITDSVSLIKLTRKNWLLQSGPSPLTSKALIVVPVVNTCKSKSTTEFLVQAGRFSTPEPNSTSGMLIQVFAANTAPMAKAEMPTYIKDFPRCSSRFGMLGTRSKGDLRESFSGLVNWDSELINAIESNWPKFYDDCGDDVGGHLTTCISHICTSLN